MAKRKGRSREFIDDSDDPEDTGVSSQFLVQFARAHSMFLADQQLLKCASLKFLHLSSVTISRNTVLINDQGYLCIFFKLQ